MPTEDNELDIQPYSYANQIMTPDDLGIRAGTSWDNISDGFSGLIAYMKVLVVGGGKAQRNCWSSGKEISGCTKPLGDRYLLKTMGKCNAKSPDASGAETEELVTRYVYLNNIPDGQIPFMGAATKGVMPKGLVPGVFKNIAGLNPIPIIKSFTESSKPDCTAISVSIVDTDNTNRIQVAHVANSEIKDIDPCVFAQNDDGKRINPITTVTCTKSEEDVQRTGFTNRYGNNLKPLEIPQISDFPEDPIIKVYYISIGLLMLYILTKHIHKVNKKINIK